MQNAFVRAGLKQKQRDEQWLRELWDYEAKHPIAFASPRALIESRFIAEMGRPNRKPRRRNRTLHPKR